MDTKFKDMTVGQRDRWLAWANSHDWGATSSHYFDPTGDLVTFGASNDGHGNYEERAVHRTPKELRAWAGY